MLYAAFGALRAGFPAATAADMSWVLNAYTVVYAAMLIPAGGLADTHGRKRVFLLGVTLFIAASAPCGAGRQRRLADRRARAAGGRRGAADAGVAVDRAGGLSAEQARGDRQPVGRGGAASRRRSGRASAPSSSRTSAGRGPSSSTCRSARCRCGAARRCCANRARVGDARAGRRASAWRCSSSPSARSRWRSSKRDSPSWTRTQLVGDGRHRRDRAGRLRRLGAQRARSARRPGRCSAIAPTARSTRPR